MAKAFELKQERRHVVAVVGDGALTGGMCWEALNNIAAGKDRPVVIVVNDNGRSYSPTIGGLAEQPGPLPPRPGDGKAPPGGQRTPPGPPAASKPAYTPLHAATHG